MTAHASAGHPPALADLLEVPRLLTAYFSERPDPEVVSQRVAFGTSGHRGSAFEGSFNEPHILAITQAICEYRQAAGITGPLFLGMDTHALSVPAHTTVIEVLAAHGVEIRHAKARGYTPTPVISHAILTYNLGRETGLADGILLTPSHNPPADGGLKYNPPHGGPAATAATDWIETRANELLAAPANIRRMPYARARRAATTREYDYITPYVEDLQTAIDFAPLSGANLRLAVDPLGGAGVHYWPAIAERYRLNLECLNPLVDPTFRFLCRDWDGQLRMDPSSSYVMQGLVARRLEYDVALACDADHDRHGIVTRDGGLLPANHYLALAVDYLGTHRAQWPRAGAIGKTLVSSSLIDRVAARLGRPLFEVPVGFKWFVAGLGSGALVFGGEESAGASFVRGDGKVWTTDKDGILLCLLAAEITARTAQDLSARYRSLTAALGEPSYARVDSPATPAAKSRFKNLNHTRVTTSVLAGDRITEILTRAPGNGAAIGGVKVVTANGWFAARPSGTENIVKIYAESFKGPTHLAQIQSEAQILLGEMLK